MQMIRVLLADDHPPIRAGIRTRLMKEPDIQVVGEATNGEEALRQALERNPDVLLLDMDMPGISGVEVARRLLEQEAPVRILALSAHDNPHYISKLMEYGAVGYLTKDESLENIVAAVKGVGRGEEGWLSRRAASALMKLQRSRKQQTDDPVALLSEREREVLRLLGDGYDNTQIGETLYISESTVKKHISNIYAKLELTSRAEAVSWAWKQGLISRDDTSQS